MKTMCKSMLCWAAGTLLTVSARAMAGDRGKFQGHAVLEATKFTEYKARKVIP